MREPPLPRIRRSRSRAARAGLVVLVVIASACAAAPLLAPYPFDGIDLDSLRQSPSWSHWMGTDDLGRDVLTRILFGGRISILIGVLAAIVGTAVGTLVGAFAGYYRGVVDGVLMRLTDVAYAIPTLPLLIVLSSYSRAAVPQMVLVIGLLSWMATARVVRAEVLTIREREFVDAARGLGAGNLAILARHVVPNAVGTIVVSATLAVGNAIIVESALSFLGFGVHPPTPTWGNMLMDAQATMATKPWLTLFPGLAILVVVLAVSFVGEGLGDRLSPNLDKETP
jgi:peptide/nickel transport system permease protein